MTKWNWDRHSKSSAINKYGYVSGRAPKAKSSIFIPFPGGGPRPNPLSIKSQQSSYLLCKETKGKNQLPTVEVPAEIACSSKSKSYNPITDKILKEATKMRLEGSTFPQIFDAFPKCKASVLEAKVREEVKKKGTKMAGWRKIVVDGREYKWLFKKNVVVRDVEENKLYCSLAPYQVKGISIFEYEETQPPITPKDIEKIIKGTKNAAKV